MRHGRQSVLVLPLVSHVPWRVPSAIIRKKWYLKRSTISHPLRGCTPHFSGTSNVEEQLKVHRMQDPRFAFNPKPETFDDCEVVCVSRSVLWLLCFRETPVM